MSKAHTPGIEMKKEPIELGVKTLVNLHPGIL